MPRISIQRRLITTVVISQLLLAAGLVWGSVYLNHRLLRRAFDNALQERAMSIAALVRYSEDTPPHLIFEYDMLPPALERNHPDLYRVSANTSGLIARSNNWPADSTVARGKHDIYSEFNFDGIGYRVIQLQTPIFDREPDVHTGDVLTVSYGSPLDELNHEVLVAGIYTAVGTAILLCLGVGFAIWGMRRGLRPLAQLASSAAQVSPVNWELKASEEAVHTTELAPLTTAMTSMLGGLHGAFNQQREFVANAAHELKTPIAILKSTLQLLLQRPRNPDEYRAGLEQALTDLDRLEQLVHLMLRLARAERSADNPGEVGIVDIAATCQTALDLLDPLIRQRAIHVAFAKNGPMLMRADADDLRLVWSNLLENAVRYSPPQGQVEIQLRQENGKGRIEISDNGPGIAPADLPRIFDRFYRGDTSRTRDTGGYGLGLAISKAIVEAYGGSVNAESIAGRGTSMVVLVPLVSAPSA